MTVVLDTELDTGDLDFDLLIDLRIGVIDGDPDIDLRIGEFDGDLDGEFNKASEGRPSDRVSVTGLGVEESWVCC